MFLQIAQLLTVRRQQEIEQGIAKRESRSIERCGCSQLHKIGWAVSQFCAAG